MTEPRTAERRAIDDLRDWIEVGDTDDTVQNSALIDALVHAVRAAAIADMRDAAPPEASDEQRECDRACTSGCHSDDCEHHGYIPRAAEQAAEVARLREVALRDAGPRTTWSFEPLTQDGTGWAIIGDDDDDDVAIAWDRRTAERIVAAVNAIAERDAKQLDVERLALALHRRVNPDNAAINLDELGYSGEPDKWERHAAEAVAAEYALLTPEPLPEPGEAGL